MVIVNKRFLIFLIIGIGTIILLAVIWNALINRREQSDIVLPDTVEVESRTEEQYVIINTLDKEVAEEIEAELESQGKKGIPSGNILRQWRAGFTQEELPYHTHDAYADEPYEVENQN
ncbi:MAG: hypothetical protein TR69_WS6001000205 [candidate division WS6 bacterium OLB20]|uniref:Uncharacterized protein n=1 Tax=candidate division WS6 bacterium OLB20 TaxID=1617426 RepID=A0A136M099_9BACT|nr:MAG: hypothetical protein TR69_WS6001000205 [candidate division WS6 bacterium OLB20]